MLFFFDRSGYCFPRPDGDVTFQEFHHFCRQKEQPLIYAKRDKGKKTYTARMDFFYNAYQIQLTPLSVEKVRTLHERMLPSKYCSVVPRFTYAHHLTQDQACYLVAAYWIIWAQQHYVSLPVPAPPADLATSPQSKKTVRITQAKEHLFVQTVHSHDTMGVRWRAYCEAHGWPYVQVHEARRGRATVEVRLPEDRPFTDEMLDQIRQTGHAVGIRSWKEKLMPRETHYIYWETQLRTVKASPTENALSFARAIVGMLDEAGYFPAVDRGWIESAV